VFVGKVIQAYAEQRGNWRKPLCVPCSRILRKKGYLEQVPTIERGFRLRPTVSRETVAHARVKHIVAPFSAGRRNMS
jgi:hypothetical protein